MKRDEAGQITVLIVGFALVLLLLVGVVVDASAAYLQRQSLANLADGAALSGAGAVRGVGIYEGGVGEHVPIDPQVARDEVAAYLRDLGAYADHPGLTYTVQVRDDRVEVRVSAPLDLPFHVAGVTDARVSATGSALVVVEP